MEWTQLRDRLSWEKGGIRRRLLTAGLFFVALALLVNTLAGYFYTRMEMRRFAAQIQFEVASRVAHEMDNFMRRKAQRLEDLAAAISLHEVESGRVSLLAYLLIKNDSSYSDVAVLNDKGWEVLKISERRVYLSSDLSSRSKEEKFTVPLGGKNFISPVYTSDKAEPYVTVAVPIQAAPNKVIGVLTAELNLRFLWQIIGEITFGSAGYAYLVDNRGNLIAHKDPSRVLKRQPLAGVAPVARFLRKPFSPDTEPAAEVLGLIGSPVLSTYAPVPGVGWAVIVEEPLDEAFADLRRMRRFALLLLVVGLVVGAVMIAVASDEITKPIRELHRGVELIGKGNLDHRVEIKSGDEIERLAEGFNKMAAELKSSYSTLEQKVAQRTHELSVLYDVTATVNQSLDLDVILREVIQKVLETMRFDAVRIYLLEPEGKELRMRAHHGIGPEFLSRSATDPVGVGIIGTVALTGKPLIFEDIGTDLQYGKLARGRLAQEMGFHAHVSFPLNTTTKTLGVMNFLCYPVRALLPNEVALLTAMANQIGIALENASLFADSREKTAELEKVNANLAEANRAKAEFMAAMSHELRTPLNVIIGSADLAKDGFFGQVTSQQKDAMERILRYSKMLLKMVNDVLTLTRIEAKKMTLEVSTFHLEEILFHIRTYMEQLNQDRRLRILWEIDSPLPPLTTDAMKLEEILQNLIGNAFKFTPQGRIEVRVRDLPKKGRIEFAVVDTGIGIDESNLQKIFDDFHQLKDAHTGDYGGVGLGLSIVKKYLELMQGDIQVKSRPGSGSIFSFTLPYAV